MGAVGLRQQASGLAVQNPLLRQIQTRSPRVQSTKRRRPLEQPQQRAHRRTTRAAQARIALQQQLRIAVGHVQQALV